MFYLYSDIFCPVVIMLSLNQAALLSIQLSVIHQVIAGIHLIEPRNKHVSEGDSVMFTCNASLTNVTQIAWTKNRCTFVHSFELNKTFSNFSSQRLRIDPNSPSMMNIFDAQLEDAGFYTCSTTGIEGVTNIKWNLIVSEKPEEISFSWNLLYILTSVFGFLLCGFTLTVCLSRKSQTNPQDEDLMSSRTLSYVQYHDQSGGEVFPAKPHSCVKYRMNHEQRLSEIQEAQF